MDKKQLIIIVVLMALIVVGLVGGYYYGRQTGYQEGVEVGRAAAQVELGDVVSNPMENMPSANPFEEVVNPFEEAYQNPFE